MNWELILYLLENFTITRQKNRNFTKADYILFLNENSEDLPDAIYIADGSAISPHFINALVIYTHKDFSGNTPKHCNNYICLSKGTPADIANTLLKARSHLSLLSEKLSSAGGNQEVIDIASEFLKRPSFYLDASYRILAITQNLSIAEDPEWEHMSKQGFLSMESARKMQDNGDLDLLADKTDPFPYHADFFPCQSLVCNIHLNGRFYSRFNMLFDDAPTQLNIQECRIICANLKRIAQSSKDSIPYAGPLIHMVLDLLKGRQLSEELIYDRLSHMPQLLHSLIQVCCIETNLGNDPQVLKYYSSLAERIFSREQAFALEFEEKVVLILHAPDVQALHPLHKKLDSLLQSQGLKGSVSNLFHRFNALRDYYLQAETILSLSEKPQGLTFFHEVYFQYLLSFVPLHQAIPMVSYKIIQLAQLQKDYQFPLAETLKTYLDCNCNLQATAEKLYLHKNTALYRLNHIKEILGIDFDNSEQRMQLLFSFKILEKYPVFQ